MRRQALPWTAAAAATLAMGGVYGQLLTDPTRPPSALSAPQDTSSGGIQEDAPRGSQLQSVLLSRGRKLAVISGETVPLGGMVGEAKLVRITETEVTLKKGDETEVLKLFPGIDKQPSKRRPTRAAAGAAGSNSARQGGTK